MEEAHLSLVLFKKNMPLEIWVRSSSKQFNHILGVSEKQFKINLLHCDI